MTRGGATTHKVHYKGKNEDFLVFIDSKEDYKLWVREPEGQKTTPLVSVMSAFKVFRTHKHGAQGHLDEASNGLLDEEFGTHVEEDVIKKILESGTLEEGTMPERQAPKNEPQDPFGGH